MSKHVLSIAGGGYRGVIPAVVCEEIETRSGRSLSEIFDLMAGTSTGSIITGAASVGYSAEEIVGLYRSQGPRIFRNPRSGFRQWWHAKYPASNLYDVLVNYFGDAVLSETDTPVMTTAYDVTGRWDSTGNPGPVFFKSWRENLSAVLLSDAVQASSAAPSYFPPHRMAVPRSPDTTACLYDGGLYAGDPALCAYAEAKRLWPDEEIHVVSLGTGKLEGRTKCSKAEGLLNLAKGVHGWMLDGSMDTVPYIADRALDHYMHLDVGLSSYVAMDDASPEALKVLTDAAADLIGMHGEAIDRVAGFYDAFA